MVSVISHQSGRNFLQNWHLKSRLFLAPPPGGAVKIYHRKHRTLPIIGLAHDFLWHCGLFKVHFYTTLAIAYH